MWQIIVVGALVTASAAYAGWVLVPAAMRLRLARRIVRWAEERPAMWWLRNPARSVESSAQKRFAGCGGCGSATSVPGAEPRQ